MCFNGIYSEILYYHGWGWARIFETVIVKYYEVKKQCCGSGMFIPDPNFFYPGSRVKKISDPGSASASKEFKYF